MAQLCPLLQADLLLESELAAVNLAFGNFQLLLKPGQLLIDAARRGLAKKLIGEVVGGVVGVFGAWGHLVPEEVELLRL